MYSILIACKLNHLVRFSREVVFACVLALCSPPNVHSKSCIVHITVFLYLVHLHRRVPCIGARGHVPPIFGIFYKEKLKIVTILMVSNGGPPIYFSLYTPAFTVAACKIRYFPNSFNRFSLYIHTSMYCFVFNFKLML